MLMSTKWSGKRKLVEKRIIEQLKALFDQIRHEECGVEFWYARELMGLLDYVEWRNFENAIKKAMTSCQNNEICLDKEASSLRTFHLQRISRSLKDV